MWIEGFVRIVFALSGLLDDRREQSLKAEIREPR